MSGCGSPLTARLASVVACINSDNLLSKQLFDSLPDLDLVRVGRHLENVLAERIALDSGLLGQTYLADNLRRKVHSDLAIDPLGDLLESGGSDNDLLIAQQVFSVYIGRAH